MTRKQTSQPGRAPATAPSRTSHSPVLLLLALLAALLSIALCLPAESSSPAPSVQQHMQRILFNAAAPLKNVPFISPLAQRIRPQQATSALHSTSAMASTNENNRQPNVADSVDSDTFHPRDPNSASDSQDASNNQGPLPLPAPGDAEAIKLDMSKGDGVKLDAMGPLVVNQDGSLSRIANWNKMAEIEQKNTLRIIGKRNKDRLAALRTHNGEGDGQPADQK
ncbi:hypothetical protein SLS57_008147 [Botryosphaeria dothidea]